MAAGCEGLTVLPSFFWIAIRIQELLTFVFISRVRRPKHSIFLVAVEDFY